MTNEERERLKLLVQQIQEEKNAAKFTKLIQELNELLEGKKGRLENPDNPYQDGGGGASRSRPTS